MASFDNSLPSGTQPSASPEASGPVPAPADAAAPVCLDFLKGRCSRKRCRFLHPDLSQYQQLSGAVHAQAGRHVCEVWAMTGTCRFGDKCSRLHPVILNQPTQSMMTLLLPVAVVPQSVHTTPTDASAPPHCHEPAASAALPQSPLLPLPPAPTDFRSYASASPPNPCFPPASQAQGAPASSAPRPGKPRMPRAPVLGNFPSQWTSVAPTAPLAAATALLPPQHVPPPPGPQCSGGNSRLELQDLAQSILTALETRQREPRTLCPVSQQLRVPDETGGRPSPSPACLLSVDQQTEKVATDMQTSSAPNNPPWKRWLSPQHLRGYNFLDVLQDIHNAHDESPAP